MHAPLAGRGIGVIGRVLNVLDRSVRKGCIQNEVLKVARRLDVKTDCIDQRKQIRTRAGKIDARIFIRYFRNRRVAPSDPRVIYRNPCQLKFSLTGDLSRGIGSLTDYIDNVIRAI